MAAGDGRAWPGFEPTRRAKAQGADGERAGRRTRLRTLIRRPSHATADNKRATAAHGAA